MMKWKKTALACIAVLAGAGSAHAQSSVTIYGLVDTAVEHPPTATQTAPPMATQTAPLGWGVN